MNKVKQFAIIGFLPVIFLLPTANATLELGIVAGTDSNPFKLADQFKPQSSSYLLSTLAYRQKFDNGLYLKLKADIYTYKLDIANKNKQRVQLGFNHKFENKNVFDMAISAGSYDKTYVSRSTGEIGSSRGEQIPDRYNNQWLLANIDYRYRLNKHHTYTVFAENLIKDYENLSGFRLSNLDYQQMGMGLRWKYRLTKNFSLKSSFRYRHREFDDRRARTQFGFIIADSQLTYDYFRADIKTLWYLDKKQRLLAMIYKESKRDNYSGYYDRDSYNIALAWRYKTDSDSRINVKLKYVDYQSNNDISDNNQDEENNSVSHKGPILTVKYDKQLWQSNHYSIDGMVNAAWYKDSADNYIYEYQRSMIEVGLKLKF